MQMCSTIEFREAVKTVFDFQYSTIIYKLLEIFVMKPFGFYVLSSCIARVLLKDM